MQWRAWGTGCHLEGPGQAGDVGPCEPHEVQQDQEQGPAPGLGQAPLSVQARGARDWEQPCQEGLGGTGGETLDQVAQGGSGGPILGNIQGQVGCGFEQPGLVEDVPAHCRGVELDDL